MSLAHCIAIAIFAATSLGAAAQEKNHEMHPADPAGTVSPLSYQSAFSGYQPMADEQELPDKTWRAANNEMQRLGGHAGHMKEVTVPATASASSLEKGSVPAKTPPAQHDHGMHHHGKAKGK